MSVTTVEKACPGCKVTKPVTEFGKDVQKRDGMTARCKPCRRADNAAYQQTERGREAARRRSRQWAERNPEKVAEFNKAWRERHPGYSAEANRRWREQNPGAGAAYHQANREKAMERVLRRRNRIKATSGPVDFAALWELCEGICGLCGDPIDQALAYPDPMSRSVDHIVPLSRGGTHEQSNLQWTHLVCNIRKGATAPD